MGRVPSLQPSQSVREQQCVSDVVYSEVGFKIESENWRTLIGPSFLGHKGILRLLLCAQTRTQQENLKDPNSQRLHSQ